MPLTDTTIRTTNPFKKPLKLFDGGGLFLLVMPAGGTWWRFRYRFGGKEKSLSAGVYPHVGLPDARMWRNFAKQLLAQGIAPAAVRPTEKARETAEKLAAKNTSTVQVSVALDGTVVVMKGRAMERLKFDEARAVKNLLAKLTA